MAGFKLYISNKMECLAEELSQLVKTPPLSSVLAREIIVVQSRGMERWISMEIAKRNGVCANVYFPFPNEAIKMIFRSILPDLPDRTVFEPEIMVFKIMKVLPEYLSLSDFTALKSYLSDDENGLKRFKLSEKIAELFDQYLIFRPDMIIEWEKEIETDGDAAHWQASLWRKLAAGINDMHWARVREKISRQISYSDGMENDLPDRISIVGISYLPPFHLKVFEAVSKFIDVHFFLLNPCREYWADIVTEREIKKIKAQYPLSLDIQKDLYLEKGNSLLASMGIAGRDFHSLISGFDCDIQERFETFSEDNLLMTIQSDILNLRSRAADPESKDDSFIETAVKINLPDDSIQVHACHSPLREMEVLYDNLLAMFEADPELLPGNVFVMSPDIDAYAPFIKAVFSFQPNEAQRIPFSIADQSALNESSIITRYLLVLNLKKSRFGAAEVLDLLEVPEIRNRFCITEQYLGTIEKWVLETNIRWGIDADRRTESGFKGFHENTWKAGIERLILGYAMPQKDYEMFSGIVPYANIEGDETIVLGRFLNFLNKLFDIPSQLKDKRSPMEWSEVLKNILEGLFLADEDSESTIQMIRSTLDDFGETSEFADFDERIEFEIVQSYLHKRLKKKNMGTGFLAGGVTFCAMLPMRSIPTKVICLIGMNNDNFPRENHSLGFDLIAKFPRRGDRSRRSDDRYLFLEALISARQRLYISYIGRNIQDNTFLPPSVLVSELCDYLQENFGISEDQIIVQHRLQPFSHDYFNSENDRLFSYSKEYFEACRGLSNRKTPENFIKSGISEPSRDWKTMSADTLGRFFKNPSKYLLENRLGIYLKADPDVQENRENFHTSGLEKFLLGQELVTSYFSGYDLSKVLNVYRALGKLPYGASGDYVVNELSATVQSLIKKASEFTKNKSIEVPAFDIEIAGYHIIGKISGLYNDGLVRIRYSKLSPKDFLETWIDHILLNLFVKASLPKTTYLIGINDTWEFKPIVNGDDIIHNLLDFYWNGLKRPLSFFPESSYEYVQKRYQKGQTLSSALIAAKKKWQGSDYYWGEREDPYYAICFKEEPLDEDFQATAESIFLSILESMTKLV